METLAVCAIYDFIFEREVISSAHISLSTADHEFFGVSMVEAAQVGCYCLVPNKLRNVFTGLSNFHNRFPNELSRYFHPIF